MAGKQRRAKVPLYTHKRTLIIYLTLRALVVMAMVRMALLGNLESVEVCALTLVLLMLPSILQRRLKVELPSTMEIVILLFIYAAWMLGELYHFYIIVPHWDTVLHTLNGFNCAAIGFSLVDMLNRSERFSFRLSPLYLAIVAFCFSMTVGVCWEFIEFGADQIFGKDAQKDTVLHRFASVELDETRTNRPVMVEDIADVIIVHSDGSSEALGLGGYLDVGLVDTMKDLMVNFVGAVVFSIIGYFYVKQKGKGEFAARFIPQVPMQDEAQPEPGGESCRR